jgi:hypothetical protein
MSTTPSVLTGANANEGPARLARSPSRKEDRRQGSRPPRPLRPGTSGPQPQAEVTFGLLIANPPWRPSTKSICVPCRYGALSGSTTTGTADRVDLMVALPAAPVSKPSAYSKPEQPPPCTAMRSTSASPAGSCAISSRIFVAAPSVRLTSASCSIVAIGLMVATCPAASHPPRRETFVTADTLIVEPESSGCSCRGTLRAELARNGRCADAR